MRHALVEGDLLADLAGLAAQAPAEATLVVFHSAVLAYVDPEARSSFVAAVGALPGHWLANEAAAVLGFPPPIGEKGFALALDGRQVAWAGPHGQSLDWLD